MRYRKLLSASGRRERKERESRLKSHNYDTQAEREQRGIRNCAWPECSGHLCFRFSKQVFYLLAFTAKPLTTVLGHLKIHVDTRFSGVVCNSMVTESLS